MASPDEQLLASKQLPTVWELFGWTLASLIVFPYALFATMWSALLLIDPRWRQANDWWAWWTVAQISIPAWLGLFSTTLLAYQRRLEIDPPSAWLQFMQFHCLRSTVVTAAIGFVTIMVARRQFMILALLGVITLMLAAEQLLKRCPRQRTPRGD